MKGYNAEKVQVVIGGEVYEVGSDLETRPQPWYKVNERLSTKDCVMIEGITKSGAHFTFGLKPDSETLANLLELDPYGESQFELSY